MASKSYKKRDAIIDSPKSSKSLNSQNEYKILLPIIQFLKKEHKLSKEDLVSMYEGIDEIKVPLRIFSGVLSPLESLVKYLKENLSLKFNQIASNLNRDNRSIWRTYQQAKNKSALSFENKDDDLLVPISMFKNRDLSVLENLVAYLKEELHVSVKEISSMTGKKSSTIWTVYNRAKKKRNLNNA